MASLLKIAAPVILSYLGLMTMNMVDLLAVGRVSPAAVGAVGVGNSLFSWAFVLGMGLLSGMDFLASHAHGSKNSRRAAQVLVQAFYMILVVSVVLTALLLTLANHLEILGLNPEVLVEAKPYTWWFSISIGASLIFVCVRQFLQSKGLVMPGMWIIVIANLINIAGNYAVTLGHWGFQSYGATGSAVVTLVARLWMVLAGVLYLFIWDARHEGLLFDRATYRFLPDLMRDLLKLGIPSSLQMVFEVGVFAIATTLAASLSTPDVAAHQIVLNIASFSFMVPLGISSAGSVLVGQSLGRGDFSGAVKQGWAAIGMGAGFMLCSALVFWAIPAVLIGAYTSDPQVLQAALGILAVAALFQLFDGIQAVATGVLRGSADTRTAAIANLVGHWAVGLPIGYFLCFRFERGLLGLWIGLCSGLIFVSVTLLTAWIHRTKSSAMARLAQAN